VELLSGRTRRLAVMQAWMCSHTISSKAELQMLGTVYYISRPLRLWGLGTGQLLLPVLSALNCLLLGPSSCITFN
jgi:hypothetical protein